MRRDEKTKRPPGEKNHKHRDLDPGFSKITRRCRRKQIERVERKRPAGTTEFREEESEA